MKCTYCLKNLEEGVTRDHVFPKAWYPDSTPINIQRWKVPACKKCNGKFQKIEDYLFCRWGICLEENESCAGISRRAVNRNYFLGVVDLDNRRFNRKLSVFRDLLSSMTEYDPRRTHAGTAPKPGVRSTLAVKGSGAYRYEFSEKLVKGAEYILLKRLVPKNKYIQIYYEMAEDPLSEYYKAWESLLEKGQTTNLGPGLVIKWAINTPNYPEQSLYHFEIWGHLKFWAFVLEKTIPYRIRRIWHKLRDNLKRLM